MFTARILNIAAKAHKVRQMALKFEVLREEFRSGSHGYFIECFVAKIPK